jgi:hypothetical protein
MNRWMASKEIKLLIQNFTLRNVPMVNSIKYFKRINANSSQVLTTIEEKGRHSNLFHETSNTLTLKLNKD